MNRSSDRTLLLVACLALAGFMAAAAPLPRLKVSDDGHRLITESGAPFFWMADTAWELFHRLSLEEASRYLTNRAAKGFNVIQAVALAEFGGLTEPNAQGHRPLLGNDPQKPDEGYFGDVDAVVARANSLGLYIGFLPTWGDKWNKKWGQGPEIFNPQNAEAYGQWLGRRYRDAALVWILGGDRPVESESQREILRAMARGLRAGDGGAHLITFHPTGGAGSRQALPNEPWLDFHLRQNGHSLEFTGHYDQTRADYDPSPAKPVIDGEPIYEGHPVSFNAQKFGHSVAADVRRAFYWDVFSGACGHTYGHHSVWQMSAPGREPINSPLMSWSDALDEPGATQVCLGRRLMESRPQAGRIPDNAVLAANPIPTLIPGAGTRRYAATRDSSGAYAMIYAPVGRGFKVRMSAVTGPAVKAWWFNPRNGETTALGEFPNTGEREFTPPNPGELLDWVLVLDDTSKAFPPPGTRPTP